MPELPEVETTRRGIAPYLLGFTVRFVEIRQRQMRWPIPEALEREVAGRLITSVERRGKYLLLALAPQAHPAVPGTLLVHLGMSGSLRIVATGTQPRKHDHADIVLSNGRILRFTDPRRFGCLLWFTEEARHHRLLRDLGPEPLSESFSGSYLTSISRNRTTSVKSLIMDSHTVVGVGNIYANEALFMAGIHPQRAAGRVSAARYDRLAVSIKTVLADAIEKGGTTLRDFVGGDGKPGYFSQALTVYGRAGQACVECGRLLKERRIAQRSTVFCTYCQR